MIDDIEDIFDCYAIVGKVSREQDKIYYWEQQKKLLETFEPILKDWKYKKININQYFDILLKSNIDGIHVTSKKAPTGGYRNWTEKNTLEIATKYLKNNQHLIFSFDNYGKSIADFYPKDKKNGLINIESGWIQASKNQISDNNSVYDLYIKFGDWNRISPESINQYLYIYLKRGIFEKEQLNYIIYKLKSLLFSEKTFYNWRPFRIVWKNERGNTCFNLVTDDEYGVSINRKNGLNSINNLWTEI